MKKFLFGLILVLSVFSFATIQYSNLDDNTVAKVNNDKITIELLNANTKSILILQNLKKTYPEFYNTLTKTATGIAFLNTYNKEEAMKLVNQYLFIQFVESKGINLNRSELKTAYTKKIDEIFKNSNIAEKDINMYLFSKGYISKNSYIEDNYLKALYKKSVNVLLSKKYDEIILDENKVKEFYNKNSNKYVSTPKAELKIIKINNSEEASLTYKKIIEGYYTFDDVYKLATSKNQTQTITVSLNNQDKTLIEISKKAPGYIFEPIQYNDHYEIIKIEKKYPSRLLSYNEAKLLIEKDLKDPIVKKYFSDTLQNEFRAFKENSIIIFNKKMF